MILGEKGRENYVLSELKFCFPQNNRMAFKFKKIKYVEYIKRMGEV